MKVAGTHAFGAPRDVVWPMLLDPDVLARVMPGCEQLAEVGENEYEGALKARIGPVQGQFRGKIRLDNIREPEGYEISIHGRGPSGFVDGNGSLRLENTGETTTLSYEGDVQFGGRLASVGQRLLDSSTKAIIRQGLTELDKQIAAAQSPAVGTDETGAGSGAPPSTTGPSQTEFALGVARNLFEEYVPEEARGDLASKGGVVVAILLLLWVITNWWADLIARRVIARLEKGGDA